MSRIFNAVSCEAFLGLITGTLVRGSRGDGADGDDRYAEMSEAAAKQDSVAAEEGTRVQLCTDALAGFAMVSTKHGLADEPDMLHR